jgi:hypothetical protein
VGRITGGHVAALSTTQLKTLLGYPTTSTDGHVALFDGITGNLKDGGALTTDNSNEGAIVKKAGGVFGDATPGTDYYSPTKPVTLVGGTASATTAPLYFQSGTNLNTPEAGAMEFDGTYLYFTITAGAGNRKTFSWTDHTHTGTYLESETDPVVGAVTGIVKSNSGFSAAASSDVITLFDSGSCSGYLKSDGTCDTPEGGSGLSAWQAKTTTYTASSGDRIISDTSGGAWTLTLPATPSLGDEVDVIDGAGSWTAYNLTIGRNSTKINGAEEDLTLNVSNAHVKLVYYDATNGWRVLNW